MMSDTANQPSPPLSVTLVVVPQFSMLSLAICMDGLRIANRESLTPVYDWIVASENGAPVPSSSGLAVTPHVALADIAATSVAIVLAAYQPEAACAPGLMAWLRRQDRLGGIIGCVDTAALVLGRAGLLQGERIAVHHEVVAPFREQLGEAVLLDRTHAFEGRRLSSAGGVATMDMLLAFITDDRGPDLAARVAHAMAYRTGSQERAPERMNLPGGVARIDRRLGRLVALMQDTIEAPLPLAEVFRRAQVDPSTARRLFRRHLRKTPSDYYTRLRLERARTLLRYSHLSVGEIAVAVGFADGPSFSHAYSRAFGKAPSLSRADNPGQ